MTIESRISKQEINITDLSLEVPEVEKLPFDANQEITKEDWGHMTRTLRVYSDERLWHDFSMLAMYMKVLEPNSQAGLWGGMSDELAIMKRNKQWGNFVFQAAAMRVTYPEAITVTSDDWKNIKTHLDSLRTDNKWLLFSSTAAFAKILDPGTDLNLKSKDWEWMQDALNNSRQSKDWRVLSAEASSMKILDPDCNLDLTPQDWSGMNKELEECRVASVKWKHFAPHAMSMKILAAPKVSVEAPGVLKFYKQSEVQPVSSIAPIPEIKRF